MRVLPHVAVHLRDGRDPQTIRRLISVMTAAVAHSLSVSPETVRVIVTEVPPTHWANGDVTLTEKAAINGKVEQ